MAIAALIQDSWFSFGALSVLVVYWVWQLVRLLIRTYDSSGRATKALLGLLAIAMGIGMFLFLAWFSTNQTWDGVFLFTAMWLVVQIVMYGLILAGALVVNARRKRRENSA